MAGYGLELDPKRPRWIYLILLKTKKVFSFLNFISRSEIISHFVSNIDTDEQLGRKLMKLCLEKIATATSSRLLYKTIWLDPLITYYSSGERMEDHDLLDLPISLQASKSSSPHSRPPNPYLMPNQNLRKMELYINEFYKKGGIKIEMGMVFDC